MFFFFALATAGATSTIASAPASASSVALLTTGAGSPQAPPTSISTSTNKAGAPRSRRQASTAAERACGVCGGAMRADWSLSSRASGPRSVRVRWTKSCLALFFVLFWWGVERKEVFDEQSFFFQSHRLSSSLSLPTSITLSPDRLSEPRLDGLGERGVVVVFVVVSARGGDDKGSSERPRRLVFSSREASRRRRRRCP